MFVHSLLYLFIFAGITIWYLKFTGSEIYTFKAR